MGFSAVRKASMSVGLYRQARTIFRYLSKAEMDMYVTDKKHYSELLPKTSVLCFDVGAHTGRISEVLLELGHKVIAFEPQSECLREMKARCRPYKQDLHIEEMVLGNSPGTAELFIREYPGQTSLKSTWEGTTVDTIQISVSTLDMAIQKFGLPYYCKIDVEGWELQVLQGLSQRIPLLSFEYHQEDGRMEDAYACLDLLRSLARIEINITPSEQSCLALDEWKDIDQFKAAFQRRFEGKAEFAYGDLYIRMQ